MLHGRMIPDDAGCYETCIVIQVMGAFYDITSSVVTKDQKDHRTRVACSIVRIVSEAVKPTVGNSSAQPTVRPFPVSLHRVWTFASKGLGQHRSVAP